MFPTAWSWSRIVNCHPPSRGNAKALVTASHRSPESSDGEPIRRIPDRGSSNGDHGTEWYYETLGKVIGPLSSAQLLRKVRSGEIAANTPVRKDDSQWVHAEEVNGLFEAANRSLTHYKCPFCGSKVDKPPTVCIECDREISAVYRIREPLPQKAEPAPTPPIPPSDVDERPPTNGKLLGPVFAWLKKIREKYE